MTHQNTVAYSLINKIENQDIIKIITYIVSFSIQEKRKL